MLTHFHAIKEVITRRIQGELLVSNDSKRSQELHKLARGKGVPVRVISRDELQKKVKTETRGYAFFLEGSFLPSFSWNEFLREDLANSLVVLLDGITDPHNLGAIIRSADQFGINALVLPKNRRCPINYTVLETSSGAACWVNVYDGANLDRSIEDLKKAGYWVYGADMGGVDCAKAGLTGKIALILGSEGSGVSALLRKRCDGVVKIPSAGHIDSLNVSVAAGVLMYDIRRQQGFFNQ